VRQVNTSTSEAAGSAHRKAAASDRWQRFQ